MINLELFLFLIIYIITLFLGFFIARNKKDKNNLQYFKYKNILYFVIFIFFIYSNIIFFLSSLKFNYLYILFFINLFFQLYFLKNTFNQTRCWKQHRLIFYNFLLIPSLYFSSLIINFNEVKYFFILIFIYNILEFQFAKFSFKQILWN